MRQVNPLLPGYSPETISENISEMIRHGHAQASAVTASYREARLWFRKRFPGKRLPSYLVARRNPLPSSVQGKINQGARLFEDFTGMEAEGVQSVPRPATPDVLVVIGECDGILYSSHREGELQRFIHEFKSKSRPTFAVTPDGKQLFLLGGAYSFTERGIVDKR